MTRAVDAALGSAGRAGPAPALDAVVVSYQNADTIEDCLSALLRIPGISRIALVDHGGDEAAEVAARPGVIVVSDRANPGFGAGQNRGRTLTTEAFILMCNPDAVVCPEAIAEGVLELARAPDVAAIQGTIHERDRDLIQRSSWHSVGAAHLWVRILRLGRLARLPSVRRLSSRLRLTPSRPAGTRDVEALAAIVLLARRSALEEVGGFDAEYFMYWEDLDLSKRLRMAGWRLQEVPTEWAVHVGGASSTDSFERERQWWRGCMMYAARWYEEGNWVAAEFAALTQWATMTMRRRNTASALWHDFVRAPRALRRTRRRGAPIVSNHQNP